MESNHLDVSAAGLQPDPAPYGTITPALFTLNLSMHGTFQAIAGLLGTVGLDRPLVAPLLNKRVHGELPVIPQDTDPGTLDR